MRQTVSVVSTSGDMAVVAYDRPTACHMDCAHCSGGCGSTVARERITVQASNSIGAGPGDQVVVEAASSAVAYAVFLVYALPVILFFAGYFLAEALGASGTVFGILGFFLGLAAAVLVSRRKTKHGREIRFRIVGFATRE